jgi:hypothetical protein
MLLLIHTATENCLGNSEQRQEFFNILWTIYWNCDLVVGVVITIRPRQFGAPFSAGIRYFSSTKILPNGSGAYPGSCSLPVALSPGIKWPGNEADLSPPFSADVKNEWSYTSTPLYTIVVCIGTTLTFWAEHAFVWIDEYDPKKCRNNSFQQPAVESTQKIC